MSVTTLHTLYAVNCDMVDDVEFLIDQISDWAVSTGIAQILAGSDGAVDPTYVAVGAQAPAMSWTTSAIATVLGNLGISGLAIAADVDELGLEAWFQKITEGGTRTAGSNHVLMTMKEGIIVPRVLNAPHGGVATLAMEAIATWDGTNDPIVIATSQALTGSPTVGELFTCGQVDINGTTLEAVQNITIDFGLQVFAQGSDGLVWPTFAGIMSRTPTITIRTLDAISLSTFGLSGAAQAATASLIYLRKIAEGGTRVADATAEHIKFTVEEGRIQVDAVQGSHGQPLGSDITITPTYDGSNAIMGIDTASAIA